MSNKFYKPKNEYGDLLISAKDAAGLVDNSEAVLNERINEVEKNHLEDKNNINERIDEVESNCKAEGQRLDTKIDTFNTIGVIEIVGFDTTDDYFKERLKEISEEELKVELSRNIYILKNKEGEDKNITHSYEEYVYKYASDIEGQVINQETPPVMIRLGAVDTILAYNNRYGSVQLVHDLYRKFQENNKEVIDELYEEGIHGTVDYHTPKKGKAVAPCALLDFYNQIEENKNESIAIREDFTKADKDIYDTVISRVNALENELKTSDVEEEIDYGKSRLDRIEAAIGMNHHHCENCGCEHTQCSCEDDKCSCSDAENKCTIYCRLNEIEGDLEELDANLARVDDNLADVDTKIDEEIIRAKSEEQRIETDLQTEISTRKGDTEGLHLKIDKEAERATLEESKLKSEIGDKSDPKSNTLWRSISDTNNVLSEAKKSIWDEIGTKSETDSTVWVGIHALSTSLGENTDENTESAWANINKNKKSIEGLNELIGNKLPTDGTIWGTIHGNKSVLDKKDNELEERISTAEKDIGDKNNADEGTIWKHILTAEENISKNRSELDEKDNDLERRISTAEEDITNINNKIGDKNNASEGTIWKHILTAEHEIDGLTTETTALSTSLGDKTHHYTDSAWGRININTENIKDLNNLIGDRESSDETLWGTINKNKENITKNSSNITNINNEIGDKNNASEGTIWKHINNVEQRIDGLTTETTTLSDSVGTIEDDLKFITNEIGDRGSSTNTIWAQLEILKDSLGENNDENPDTAWGKIETTAAALSAIVPKVDNLVDHYIPKVDDLAEFIGDKGNSENSVWSNIHNLSESLGKNTDENTESAWANINKNKESIKKSDEEISKITSNISSIISRIETVENNIPEINALITSVEDGGKEYTDNEISKIDSKIDTKADNLVVGEINSKIVVLEDKISKVQHSFNTVFYTTISNGEKTLFYRDIFNALGMDSSNWDVFVSSVYLKNGYELIYPEVKHFADNNLTSSEDRYLTIKFGSNADEIIINFSIINKAIGDRTI